MNIPVGFVIAAEFATAPVVALALTGAGMAFHNWARRHQPTEPKDVPHSKPPSPAPAR